MSNRSVGGRPKTSGPAPSPAKPGYDEDVILWAQEQARLLREGRFSELDIEHIADEIEDVGKSEKRELASRKFSRSAAPRVGEEQSPFNVNASRSRSKRRRA